MKGPAQWRGCRCAGLFLRRWTDGEDVGEKNGMAGGSLLDVIAAWAGCNFDAEEVGGLTFVEDEEDLDEETAALNGFEDDH